MSHGEGTGLGNTVEPPVPCARPPQSNIIHRNCLFSALQQWGKKTYNLLGVTWKSKNQKLAHFKKYFKFENHCDWFVFDCWLICFWFLTDLFFSSNTIFFSSRWTLSGLTWSICLSVTTKRKDRPCLPLIGLLWYYIKTNQSSVLISKP